MSAQVPPAERELSAAEAAAYQRDGVVHIPAAVHANWIPILTALIDRQLAAPSRYAGDSNPGQSIQRAFSDRYLWPDSEGFRRFAFESGVGALAGQAMCSRTSRLYFDHIFVKEPATRQGTPWHQDLPYWPFKGTQICSIWLTLNDVDADHSGLRFVKGSHRWNRWFRPTILSAKARWIGSSDEQEMPDFDAQADEYEFLSFDLRAGDALLFSTAIVHGAGPNPSATRRRLAIATRWLGDDVIWDPRPGTDPIVGQEDVSIAPGTPPLDDEHFPLVWRD